MTSKQPKNTEHADDRHAQDRLDEALEESFPASDPIAVRSDDDRPRAPRGKVEEEND